MGIKLTKKKREHLKGYRLLLQKAYFDKGLGLTNYAKYLIAFFGLATDDVKTTMWIAFVYGIACYAIGRLWYKHHLIDTETEIGNMVNPFVQEMRQKI